MKYEKQIKAMALAGAFNRQIESAIGRALSEDELVVVDRARVVRQLKIVEKKKRVKSNDTERKRVERDADRLVPFREPDTRLKKNEIDSKNSLING